MLTPFNVCRFTCCPNSHPFQVTYKNFSGPWDDVKFGDGCRETQSTLLKTGHNYQPFVGLEMYFADDCLSLLDKQRRLQETSYLIPVCQRLCRRRRQPHCRSDKQSQLTTHTYVLYAIQWTALWEFLMSATLTSIAYCDIYRQHIQHKHTKQNTLKLIINARIMLLGLPLLLRTFMISYFLTTVTCWSCF